jgi:predicted dithiol-disulfide oxidoreductase (DUF899 family)
MRHESANLGGPASGAAGARAMPAVADRATFQGELDGLRVREKARTAEGDAIAAARRRPPMVEVDASLPRTGPAGPVTLAEAFEGRRPGGSVRVERCGK